MTETMPSTLKVLEISGYPPPHGGWSVRTEQLKKRMDAEGHTCVVLNTGESRRIPSPHYETVENGWVYITKVWRFCRRGFLVHTHANGEAPKGIFLALIAEVIAHWVGVGSVLTLHAGTDQVYFPREKAPVWVPVFKLLFALPRAIVCNSEDVKRCIEGYGVPADKIVPIQAFSVQYLDFAPVDVPEVMERHFGRYPRTLFCYMAMRPVYYPHVLLNAFAQLVERDSTLGMVVCGVTSHTDGDVAGAFKAMVNDLGLSDRICLVGDLSHDQFLTAMTRSLMYVRTHISDGVCSSILEALTLGVTVVACENGTRPAEVITFPAEDPQALASAVREVLAGRRKPSRASAEVPDTVRLEIDLLSEASQGRLLPRRAAVA